MDPRLLRYASATRWYLVFTAAMVVINAAAIVVTAHAVARVLSELLTDPATRTVSAQLPTVILGVAAVLVRSVANYLHTRYAHRAGQLVIGQLRERVLAALKPPHRGRREPSSSLIVTITTGLDALAPYLTSFIPAMIATALITPGIIAVIVFIDWVSGVIVAITVPLIPLFMVLIGLLTKDRTARRLEAMSGLTTSLLDLISGLPTLRALGRADGPQAQVQELGERYRHTTMQSLRIAFLSGLVLELLATLCVALVAVEIGFRLVFGAMGLYAGVFALILAPEVYAPLRSVGAQFHNSQDGMESAKAAFAVIESGPAPAPITPGSLGLAAVSVTGRDGNTPHQLSFTAPPGQITVLTGDNGAGKSTAIAVLLGLLSPTTGVVSGPADLRQRTAWIAQRPALIPGTLAENFALLAPVDPTSERAQRACAASGFDAVVATAPQGWASPLGSGGDGLSLGQRQRLAIARALAAEADIIMADEPTAHLDGQSEATVIAALVARARAGDTVLVVSHRPAMIAAADQVIRVSARRDEDHATTPSTLAVEADVNAAH